MTTIYLACEYHGFGTDETFVIPISAHYNREDAQKVMNNECISNIKKNIQLATERINEHPFAERNFIDYMNKKLTFAENCAVGEEWGYKILEMEVT